jgi:hypothetical protein
MIIGQVMKTDETVCTDHDDPAKRQNAAWI